MFSFLLRNPRFLLAVPALLLGAFAAAHGLGVHHMVADTWEPPVGDVLRFR